MGKLNETITLANKANSHLLLRSRNDAMAEAVSNRCNTWNGNHVGYNEMATVVYAVVYGAGGYCREDPDTPECAGVHEKIEDAQLHAKIVHGRVAAITLNYTPPGILQAAKELGLVKS
jgi:hypothetical protein